MTTEQIEKLKKINEMVFNCKRFDSEHIFGDTDVEKVLIDSVEKDKLDLIAVFDDYNNQINIDRKEALETELSILTLKIEK